KRPEILERARATTPGRKFHHLSLNKFFVDETYAALFVKPVPIVCLVLHYLVDRLLIDWLLIGGTSLVVSTAGYVLRRLQSGRIPTYTAYVVAGALGILSLVVWAAR
ncbi:MAG TPA: hypothetical protein VMT52_19770, partial [Planctomycetota bacterium]|nr:hypothetical protein [Planctomycetota bacterium]